MTRYDIAKFYGYNSPEEYDEAQRRKHEIFVESKKMQKPNAEKEPVEIQPVKHGRWSECYTDSRLYSGICSVCGGAAIRSVKANPLDYCPNCGAKMDGDAK